MTDDVISRLDAALEGRYRIGRELGQGGMATVYLAEDLKHRRQVAMKVLKPELAAVLGAERFVQEITTTAQLQHPHILPLFDSGTADGFLFYVMPYVEGETLRDRLNRETQLGTEEAVRITREVADALDYAHRRGVIHRDIKPENILLHDGRPVVADFGIALAVSAAAGGRMTETGLSLGTPHYMSPEQATAEKEITGRSDVYSLASVLYEMLAGDPPHTGSSAQQVIVKIIADEARPVIELRKSVPPNVAAALSRALSKLPADRFESAKAFADALADPHFTTGSASTAARSAASPPGRVWLRDPRSVVVSAVAVLALTGMAWALGSRGDAPYAPAIYDVALPDSAPLAVTPQQPFDVAADGTFLVYQAQEAGRWTLWYRSLRDVTARRIDGTEAAQRPALSPDGSRVAFLRYRDAPSWTVEVMPVGGGASSTLGNGSGEANLQWLEDGRLQVVDGDGTRALWIDPGGGTSAASRIPYCILPTLLPDGERLLCGGGGYLSAYVGMLRDTTQAGTPLWTGSPDSTQVFGSDFRAVDGRYLVYLSAGGDLLAAPFDLAARRVGRSVRLVTGINRSPYTGGGAYAISGSGALVYAHGPNRAVGHLVATDGQSVDTLAVGRDAFRLFAVSPDGGRLAAVVDGLQGEELRLYDLGTGEHRVWVRRPVIRQPIWSPRGDRLVYSLDDSVFIGDPDTAEPAELVAVTGSPFEAFSWTFDDRIVGGLWDTQLAVSLDLATAGFAGDTLATGVSFPSASPDGRWLAYNDVGLRTLWLSPIPSLGRRYQVAVGSVEEPVWRSVSEVSFLSHEDVVRVVRVAVDSSGATPILRRDAGMDLPGFVDTAGQSHQVTPDGRVLYVRADEDRPKVYLRVVPDWVAQMKRAVDEANR